MKDKKVPDVVAKRLPRYYRYLDDLIKKNIYRISSGELSKKMGVTASQIRQDFNFFGGFGQQGYGYNVEQLKTEIAGILGLDTGFRTILMGAGYLGHALANHSNFEKRGFKLIGIFDVDKSIIGKKINGVEVYDNSYLKEFMEKYKPEIAILAVPKAVINDVSSELISYGIKGLWNFSYAEIKTDSDIPVENVHLSDSLMMLSYKIKKDM